MSLSFVYPVYNEIENLPRLAPETQRIAEGLFADYEIVLVDDGSTDGSGSIIDQLASEHPCIRAVHHRRNRGLGAAITTGLAHATKDLVLYMDSDFPVSWQDARAILSAISPEADLVIGNRLGRAEGPRREIMSWTYNQLIRWVFGLKVRDVNFAFKLIRAPVLQQMRLRSEGSFIDAEMLLEARRLQARIVEVPIKYHTRVAGQSTAASNAVVLRILGEMWRYWWRRRTGRAGPARLIINADDLGLCKEVNEGIVRAFDEGLVTSASLMPTGEAFAHAVELALARPELDLGVHLALSETKPVSPPDAIPSLVTPEGRFPRSWRAFLGRYLARRVSREEMERELRAQLERVAETGLRCSHLDGHQHLHLLPGLLPIVTRLAEEYGIGAVRYPHQRRWQANGGVGRRLRRRVEACGLGLLCRLGARRLRAAGLLLSNDFRGFGEAGAWSEESLIRTLADVDGGLTELCCHPGANDGVDARLHWGYAWEQELAALTSDEVRAARAEAGVTLTTYRDCLGAARAKVASLDPGP
jgi:hopanoid biosynthesis associated protein HpnK